MSLLANREPSRQVKPVTGTARWLVKIGPAGVGVLEITTARGRKTYEVTVHRQGSRVLGFRLQQPPVGPAYDIDATGEPWQCDCPDAVSRRRECKHVLALKAALVAAYADSNLPADDAWLAFQDEPGIQP